MNVHLSFNFNLLGKYTSLIFTNNIVGKYCLQFSIRIKKLYSEVEKTE